MCTTSDQVQSVVLGNQRKRSDLISQYLGTFFDKTKRIAICRVFVFAKRKTDEIQFRCRRSLHTNTFFCQRLIDFTEY